MFPLQNHLSKAFFIGLISGLSLLTACNGAALPATLTADLSQALDTPAVTTTPTSPASIPTPLPPSPTVTIAATTETTSPPTPLPPSSPATVTVTARVTSTLTPTPVISEARHDIPWRTYLRQQSAGEIALTTEGLPDKRVTALGLEPEGAVWVDTENGIS